MHQGWIKYLAWVTERDGSDRGSAQDRAGLTAAGVWVLRASLPPPHSCLAGQEQGLGKEDSAWPCMQYSCHQLCFFVVVFSLNRHFVCIAGMG